MGERSKQERSKKERSNQEPEAGLDHTLQEMEDAGMPRAAIDEAVRRAKIKTALRRARGSSPPPSRPKLDTNPELDSWFD